MAIGLVVKSDAIEFVGAAGEAAPGVPAGIDTIVRLDSITKPLTATGIMILADRGKLNLSDPVSKFIPAFTNLRVASNTEATLPRRAMTIRDLLTHTGGLAGYSPDVDALWSLPTNLDFAEGIARLPLRHHPGDGFQYGNAYEVLPAVIAAASGAPFDEFLKENVFDPLRMQDTYFVVPNDKRIRYAALYTKNDAGGFVVQSAPDDPETESFPSGGGGLKSTAGDYARFAQMLLNRGELDGVRILSAEAVDLMTRPQVDKSVPGSWQEDYAWGYGMAVRREVASTPEDRKPVGSYGWNGGLGTLFFVDPVHQLIGVVVTQMGYGNDYDLREKFEAAAYSALGD